MAKRKSRPKATDHESLKALNRNCPACSGKMNAAYLNSRTLRTLDKVVRLSLQIRRCLNPECLFYKRPYRPEMEGRFALPQHEFGLDVIARIGFLRHAEHRSIPEIHLLLVDQGLEISQRAVNYLLDRYEELLALTLADDQRLKNLTFNQGRVILAIDGLAPQKGNEVLWLIRDCLSGEVLLAKSLLSSRECDLVPLIESVKDALTVPIVGVVSDGQRSLRNAISTALPEVPHQLCHFHFFKEAARPIIEADRHAKKELKKRVRGIRKIERECQDSEGNPTEIEENQVVAEYCAAVRSSLVNEPNEILGAPGIVLNERLTSVSESLERVDKKRGSPRSSKD